MIEDLFVNMTILITFISLGSQMVKKYKLEELHSLRVKITIGIVSGILGIILMLFAIKVHNNTIIDFHNVAIIMPAVFGGGVSVFISGIMIALFRVTYFGVSKASMLAVIGTIINVTGCWLICRNKISSWRKWTYSTILVLFTSSIMFTILLRNIAGFLVIMIMYCTSCCIVSAITFSYVNYSLTANSVFRRLQKESTKDFLTDLNNVRQFDLILNNAVKNAREKDENLSILMVDIDFFKKVNDTYGHKEGDVVLKELGKILRENCRNFDEVSRNGGEEFSVLLLDCPNSQAIRIAERIRHNVEIYPFILSTGTQINITVSIGVASYPETVKELEKLVEKSDTELYAAKRTGRNKVCSDQSCFVINKG